MQINKLVIRGFGPYATEQVLDFDTYLADKSIFVITGDTGAGKTTIFDAINFALYGEASGSDRDGKSLRSDYAAPTTPTEVELTFTVRNKAYKVTRNPAYQRAKARGSGVTSESANAVLEIPGKTITGVENVFKGTYYTRL